MEGQILLSDYAIFKCSGIAKAQIETEWFNVCLKKKKVYIFYRTRGYSFLYFFLNAEGIPP